MQKQARPKSILQASQVPAIAGPDARCPMIKGYFTCNGRPSSGGRQTEWPGGLAQNQNSNIKWEMFTAWTDKDLKCLHGLFFYSFFPLFGGFGYCCWLRSTFLLCQTINHTMCMWLSSFFPQLLLLLLLSPSFAMQRFVDKATFVLVGLQIVSIFIFFFLISYCDRPRDVNEPTKFYI